MKAEQRIELNDGQVKVKTPHGTLVMYYDEMENEIRFFSDMRGYLVILPKAGNAFSVKLVEQSKLQ